MQTALFIVGSFMALILTILAIMMCIMHLAPKSIKKARKLRKVLNSIDSYGNKAEFLMGKVGEKHHIDVYRNDEYMVKNLLPVNGKKICKVYELSKNERIEDHNGVVIEFPKENSDYLNPSTAYEFYLCRRIEDKIMKLSTPIAQFQEL